MIPGERAAITESPTWMFRGIVVYCQNRSLRRCFSVFLAVTDGQKEILSFLGPPLLPLAPLPPPPPLVFCHGSLFVPFAPMVSLDSPGAHSLRSAGVRRNCIPVLLCSVLPGQGAQADHKPVSTCPGKPLKVCGMCESNL